MDDNESVGEGMYIVGWAMTSSLHSFKRIDAIKTAK